MNNFLTLTQLNKEEISRILEVATQMRRIVKANYKKGPQLIGSMVAGIFENQDKNTVAYSLATQYLSGSYCERIGGEALEQGKTLCNMGVNTLVVANSNDNIVHTLASSCTSKVVNAGSTNSDPIGVLADVMALLSKLDGLSNLNILVVGNKLTNKMQELIYILELFGSSVLWYLPSDDFVTTRRGIVIDKMDVAFKGSDAVIDLGLTPFSQAEKYYGTSGGIDKSMMDKCGIDAPLLGSRVIVDNIGIKEYNYNLVNVRDTCYVSIVMAVLYLLNNK